MGVFREEWPILLLAPIQWDGRGKDRCMHGPAELPRNQYRFIQGAVVPTYELGEGDVGAQRVRGIRRFGADSGAGDFGAFSAKCFGPRVVAELSPSRSSYPFQLQAGYLLHAKPGVRSGNGHSRRHEEQRIFGQGEAARTH